MWLVIGLGNPGAKYECNRHNIGFRVVDALLAKHGLPEARSSKYKADVAQGTLKLTGDADGKIVACKPMEFMNLSGFAVQRVAGFHHVTVENMVVVHDEIDLDFGLVRVKNGGGHGGHNGLRSMIDQLGSNAFARVRVGVGKPQGDGRVPGDKDVAAWVLGDFSLSQADAVGRMIDASVAAVESVVAVGIAKAMNACNGLKSLV
jgi:peptidyl-tRNA hydrolase, PTH1 family